MFGNNLRTVERYFGSIVGPLKCHLQRKLWLNCTEATIFLELWSAISRGRISDVTAACRVPADTSFSLCGTRFYDYCWSEAFATLIFFSSCENKLLISSRGFVLDRWSLAQNKEILVVTLNAVSSDVNDFSLFTIAPYQYTEFERKKLPPSV